MLYELKEAHNVELVRFLALQMAAPIRKYVVKRKITPAITYAPRTKQAIRRFGYDHSYLLAKELARILGLPFVRAIKRSGGRIQKEANAAMRRENASRSFKANTDVRISGRHFILIDDVITTGATVVACKNVLRKNGAKSVTVASLYQSIVK